MNDMIFLEDLTFSYPHLPILFSGFNWKIKLGESWAVLGPSGCGKTTLLYLLAGLLTPTHGRILINGERVTRPRPQTGLILQDYGLLPWATVRENIQLGQRIRAFYGPDGKHSPTSSQNPRPVDDWLKRLGLIEVAKQYPGHLSGGQRQRTAIARTLILQPDLLLMDEPFSSLDALTREDLQNLTMDLWREQKFTMLMVTHSIEEAACLGQKILLLANPPHLTPLVIENLDSSLPGFRNSPNYQEVCHSLRNYMESTTI
jgi:ABC-type nitrate/sulfonate/bicarbonate transport system ATPase subunit